MTLAPDHLTDPRPLRSDFVAAMANAATGVTVVATDGPAGRFAQTVSAMTSVSADPPSLLVCVNRRSPLADAAARNGVFAVSVLAVEQAHVSDVFAGRAHGGAPYDFGCAPWRHLATGAPALTEAAAVFDCRLSASYEHGTHRILLGDVRASGLTTARPLVHHARAYGAPRAL
ncbi:flavin reductase family protein [Streptomyces pinistramenti]|uniref:flavin reductase family protein n=1 Tax=Streptomyces pinistramenti TaxID=2884812 RepID=UPI001D05D11C|nr:flavin reductase family protein [Streptomyces pinistramenti]MCB5909189.1 flavin reductase family protein [Streptomyces pinistramenti]